MKFTVSSARLADALKVIGRACPGKTALPILTHILLAVEGDVLTLTATDLELAMLHRMQIVNGEDGTVALPGKMLQALVAKLPDNDITLTLDAEKDHVTISGGNAEYVLYGLPGGEYPAPPVLSEECVVSLPGQDLCRMIRRTQFAILNDETRPQLTGACFSYTDGEATMAATDTHRLAVDRREIAYSGEDFSIIIRDRGLSEILHLIGKDEEEVFLRFTGSLLSMQVGATTLVMRLIEGEFPDWRRIYREESATTVHINPDTLHDAIERASLIARWESNKVFLEFDDSYCRLSAHTDVGLARETLPCVFEGQPIEIACNAEYLLDAMREMITPSVTLHLNERLQPVIITGEKLDGYFCIVMPMQML